MGRVSGFHGGKGKVGNLCVYLRAWWRPPNARVSGVGVCVYVLGVLPRHGGMEMLSLVGSSTSGGYWIIRKVRG